VLRGRRSVGCAHQQSVLRRDVRWNPLCPDLITVTGQAPGSHDINRERIVHPPGERAGVARINVVTTGQHRDARPRDRRALEHEIGQRPTCMDRYDDVSGQNFDDIELTCHEREPSAQPGPTCDERLVERGGRGWHHGVDRERAGRAVVEDQHQLREQPVTSGEIDNSAAAKQAAHAARGFPRFVQLLAGKTPGMADGSPDAIEKCFTWKARKVSSGEAPT